MPDRFEQSFSSLAYSYLQEKALNLLEYLVGFEVVEKDDTGTRGLGILAFKVRDQYLYAPVFFLSGEIKPLELLYIRDKDLFVPLDEDWVDYLLKNKPLQLGEGIRLDKRLPFSQPDLDLFATPPITGKHITASWSSPESFMRALSLQKESSFRALHFLEEAPAGLRRAFLKKAQEERPFFMALLENYGWDLVKKAALEDAPDYRSAEGEKKCANCRHFTGGGYCDKFSFQASRGMTCDAWAGGQKKSASHVITSDSDPALIRRLDPAAREHVMFGGMAYLMDKQAQSEEAKVYHTQYEDDLQNPHSTAVYDVLDHTGNFVRSLVLLNPQGAAKYGEHKATVIELGSGRFVCAPVSKIWVKKWAGVDEKPDLEHYDHILQERKTVPIKGARVNKHYVLLNRNLNSSSPFKVLEKMKDSNGLVSYLIKFVEGEKAYPTDTEHTRNTRNVMNSTDINPRAEEAAGAPRELAYAEVPVAPIRMIISPKISGGNEKIYLAGEEFIVPASFELLPLEKSKDEVSAKFGLGGPGALLEQIKRHTKASNMRVVSPDGMFFTVNYGNIQARSLEKTAAVSLLVETYRINPQIAFNIVKQAEDRPRRPVDFLVKQSQTLLGAPEGVMDPLIVPDISIAPGGKQLFNEELVVTPNEYPNPHPLGEDENLYTGQIGSPGAPEMINPNLDIQLAMASSGQGEQQVFDHALLGTLARSSEVSELIQKYIPDMEQALDKLGRLLFLYWWHHEDFKELFGIIKLDELEDQVRNVFKTMGKLILELKRKERVRLAEF